MQAENQNIEANTFFMKLAILPEVDLRQWHHSEYLSCRSFSNFSFPTTELSPLLFTILQYLRIQKWRYFQKTIKLKDKNEITDIHEAQALNIMLMKKSIQPKNLVKS